VDWLVKKELFPTMQESEWIVYRNMGSYNYPLATRFNGFELPKLYYIEA
jgi:diaminopimelate decarboxylase